MSALPFRVVAAPECLVCRQLASTPLEGRAEALAAGLVLAPVLARVALCASHVEAYRVAVRRFTGRDPVESNA